MKKFSPNDAIFSGKPKKKPMKKFYDEYDPLKTSHKKGKPFRQKNKKRSYLD